ncbi:MAG: ribosomal protein S18-alanine N-acetyltransferase [Halanaerobiales bacterium]
MLRIIPMTLDHLSRVMQIERESFSDPWSLTSFVGEITDNPYAIYFVALYDEQIAGYIGGWLVTDELHITNLAIARENRRHGIAQELIDWMTIYACEQGMSRATLEVRASNNSAINLYRKKGFTSVGYRPNYYTNNGEDAMIMWKELGEFDDES